MKLLFYVAVIAVPLTLLAILVNRVFGGTPSFTVTPLISFSSPTPTAPPPASSADLATAFRISWFIVKNPETISLIPNFGKKESGQTVKAANSCRLMTSGGFYSTQDTPIGLFAIPGTVLSPASSNSLFNGFFSVTPGGKGMISTDVPQEGMFRLQSGPLLRIGNQKTNLKIKNDELARRIFAAVDPDGSVLFGAVYSADEVYKGPMLADLPELLDRFQAQTDFRLADAINLDGGSASVFAGEDLFLQELTGVGSFFCIK